MNRPSRSACNHWTLGFLSEVQEVTRFGGLNWRLRGWFRHAHRLRGGWLICLGGLLIRGRRRQVVA